jgi:hypothetical protein
MTYLFFLVLVPSIVSLIALCQHLWYGIQPEEEHDDNESEENNDSDTDSEGEENNDSEGNSESDDDVVIDEDESSSDNELTTMAEQEDRSRIDRSEELDFLNTIKSFLPRDVTLRQAHQLLIDNNYESYSFYPLHVRGSDKKMPLKEFDPNIIGVVIEDEKFDFETSVASEDAVIVEVVDVGGVDAHSRVRI